MATADDNGVRRRQRILAVADWSVEPRAVADALRIAAAERAARFRLLVPARLPVLGWIGDPFASRPCAERHLAELARLARTHGIEVEEASVGDPERVAAIRTALEQRPADRILVFDRRGATMHPFSLARRLARIGGPPVEHVAVPGSRARRVPARRALRCAPAAGS